MKHLDKGNEESSRNQYVYVKAEFGGYHVAEQVVMVSFHSGYIFIQTDKPLYTPGDTVLCRAFVSTPPFQAFNSSITIEFQKPFLSLDCTELVVEITARYLYGGDVQGTAYVMFGVEVNKEKRRLPSVKQVTNLQQDTATLTMAEIRKAYPDLSSLVGSSVYVKASVLTKSGSDLVEAEKSGIKIVESPYVLSFIDTPKYYKPGLPFDIMIQVSFQDGSPAHNVPVQVSHLAKPIASHLGTIRTAINMPAALCPQIITAETKQTGLQPEQQARQQMTLHPYTPFDRQRQNYLYISTGTTTVSLGQSLGLSLHINTADKAHRELITHLTYLVLNKGKIIVAKRLEVGGVYLLESHGLDSPVTVTITVHNYPERRYQLLQDTVTLGPANSYHTLKIIKLPSEHLDKGNEESSRNQYVYVKAEFGGYHVAEQVVMVSFHSGYIFIQTDKPLYTPGDTVLCRAFVSTPPFQAFNSSITIEFQNSDGVVVKQISRTRANNGIFADTHVLPDIVNEGTWKIIAKFDNWQQNKFSSEFEVKKYVLPAFNVTLTPKKPFLSLDCTELVVEITARYLYGGDVQGTAYVMFGVEVNKEKRRLPSVKQVTNLQQDTATLTMAEIRKAYPDLSSLVGSSVYVKASVLTKSGSDLVEAEKSGIKIVESPYVLSFIDTPKYYKPGLPFDIMIQVSFQDGSPAHNVPVQVSHLAKPIASHLGTIRTAINMPAALCPQIITAETKQTGLQPEQQARQQMTLHPYTPFDRQRQNYLYISTGTTTVSLGQSLGLSLHINTADKAHRELITHLTYLVLNKGKIIVAKRLEVGGQDMTNVLLTVTTEMMPSFRVVAFYMVPWAGTSEVVADSVWVDVDYACVGAACSAQGGPEGGALLRCCNAELNWRTTTERSCCIKGQRVSFAEEEEEEEEEDDFMEESEVTVRSKFYESWLWRDLALPSVPEDSRDGLAMLHVESIFPDTITQWGVLAISSSPVTGRPFPSPGPWNVRAWKRFFVDMKLPYSVARNEHVEIKAVLHNYGDKDMEVKVVLLKTEDMCSVAFNEKHTQEVTLKGSSSLVVPYTIIPLKAGEMLLEVLAMAKGFMGSDGVKKKLRVDKVVLGSLVPNSQPETFINIRGNLLADTIDNSISGDSLASLIRMPGGCVEQNLASITLPLIATVYLDRSNDWETVGVQRRVEAINYIQKGYQKQLVYKKKDDSYPPYRNEGTSTWYCSNT
eukprot:XP_013986027.1 PREDICTED: cobra venom factor-like [Salmo salar]